MHTRNLEIERDHGDRPEYSFRESLGTRACHGTRQAMDAVQQFRRGDGRDRDQLVVVLATQADRIELATLDGNEDARVNQRPHGLRRTRGRLWRAAACSTASRYSLPLLGKRRTNALKSAMEKDWPAAGPMCATAFPPRSMM